MFSQHLRAILRAVYHLLYHSFAWSYDLVAAVVSAGHWNAWAKEAVQFLTGQRILETGFGPGYLQVELQFKGFIPFGLDESWPMCRQANRRTHSHHFQGRLIRGISQKLPFSSVFDSVVATFPSEYIFDSETIKEIYRVLKPRGRLVILLSAFPSQNSRISRIMRQNKILSKAGRDRMYQKLENAILLYHTEGFTMERKLVDKGNVSLLFLIGEK